MKLNGFPIKLPNRRQMRSKIDTSIGLIISKIILRIQNDFFNRYSNDAKHFKTFLLFRIDSEIKIFEVYRKSATSFDLVINLVSKYSIESNKLVYVNLANIWERRHNLTGVHLRVTNVDTNPFVFKQNGVSSFFK
jgi:hypothetical protein